MYLQRKIWWAGIAIITAGIGFLTYFVTRVVGRGWNSYEDILEYILAVDYGIETLYHKLYIKTKFTWN